MVNGTIKRLLKMLIPLAVKDMAMFLTASLLRAEEEFIFAIMPLGDRFLDVCLSIIGYHIEHRDSDDATTKPPPC